MRCYTERILLMAQALTFDGITYGPTTYAETLFAITARNAGYAGRKLGEAKFVLFANYLAQWLFRLLNRKRAPFYRTLDAVSAKNVRLEPSRNSAENGEGFRSRGC